MNYPFDLKQYHTFKINTPCRILVPLYSELDVYKALVYHEPPYKILGGGSNILPTGPIGETILHNKIKGISVIDEDDKTALVAVGSGENWHQFISWSLSHNLGGLENLSLIPGKVGAAPIQNIGAYGVEQDSCFHSLKAINIEEGISKTFYKEDCKFGYRDSVFKKELKGKYIITQVNYLLSKIHNLNTSYGAIATYLEENGIINPTINDVSRVIIDIRNSKLPDPNTIPNAGSFFKNPIISSEHLSKLKSTYSDIKYYKIDDSTYKVPAAWLIDKAGYKGKKLDGAGIHKNHALVLINYGEASGQQILELATKIENTVLSMFDINLEKEVNIW